MAHSAAALEKKFNTSRDIEPSTDSQNALENRSCYQSKEVKNDSNISLERESATNAPSFLENITSGSEECVGGWFVASTAEAFDADYAVSFINIRPSIVTITGARWQEVQEDVIHHFLCSLSKIDCSIYLTPRDALWRANSEGRKRTRARIETLLAEGHRCTMFSVWGAFDLPTLRLLPTSVRNVGIALSSEKDMQLLEELDRLGDQLESIHLSFMKTFKKQYWRKWSLTATNVSTCFHFPHLHGVDLKWMLSLVSDVVPSDQRKSSVGGLYFPGTSLPADVIVREVVRGGLQCAINLPASAAVDDAETKKVVAECKKHKCSVEWILEDL